ncbi:GNAT family N-acetyltransferase [uncultured Streptomyces sp.]|uniref:GNAT family N-acetyltransferase n=1 Tax=uncultured Streptomyces sp. TaxID=174707 RepID=UPI00261B6171|nr:GNAT family N-acetyltransferase [uncultured Streptomyces sp.]
MKLRTEAERWLASAGIDQWHDPKTRGPALEKWKADIAAGRTWVVEEQGLAVATVTLASADRDFWNASDRPDEALYVAKLITARSVRGKNLGGRLLDWVGSQARQREKPWIRLDCWRTNTKLQDFYLAEGFQHVRTEAPPHRMSGWLGQRASSIVRYADPLRTERDQVVRNVATAP